MIKMTKMSGDEITVNADLIETVQATPDTVITLTSKKKILVKDSVEQIVEKVIEYHKEISSCLKVEKG
jgi:flagellar protein FlbD